MKHIILLALIVSISGCHLFKPKPPIRVKDPQCEAWIAAPYQTTTQELNLDKYKDIDLEGKKEGDEMVIVLPVEDYSLLIELLGVVEGHVGRQAKEIGNMKEYYKPKDEKAK